MIEVLHVPYVFFPDACGGTEVYALELAKGLVARGCFAAVAAPADVASDYVHEGVRVHRFAIGGGRGLPSAYGEPDSVAAEGFRAIVDKVRPQVVHLHARTSAVSELLVDVAHAAGAKVVLTYHTPTVSCARGTMLLFGIEPCDGRLERVRCGACVLAGHGLPALAAKRIAALPDHLTERLAQHELPWPFAGLRIPGLVARGHARFRSLMEKVDRVVAVSAWVEACLLANSVDARKLVLSQQGVGERAEPLRPTMTKQAAGPLRIAFFGRLDPAKGVDILLDALGRIPEADVQLDLFLVGESNGSIETAAGRDTRVVLRAPVSPASVRQTMRGYDLVAVPSIVLETGPLVVLEGFAAGVPVIGTNRGGIAELVRDGVDGVLLPPDAGAWALALVRLASDRSAVDRLREGVRPGRTNADVVSDMLGLYRALVPVPATAA